MTQNNTEIKSFIKRKKRINSTKKREIAKSFLPTLLLNLAEVKKLEQKVSCEIGFGSGENILQLAINNPDKLYIGCEVYENGVVNLATEIYEHKLNNIKIFKDDAIDLLKAIPSQLINEIFILFPDPWPKKRHYKRRLINQQNLDLLAEKLADNSIIHIATDFENYADWILGKFCNHKSYQWLNINNYNHIPKYFSETKYFLKAKAENSEIYFFDFIKS